MTDRDTGGQMGSLETEAHLLALDRKAYEDGRRCEDFTYSNKISRGVYVEVTALRKTPEYKVARQRVEERVVVQPSPYDFQG